MCVNLGIGFIFWSKKENNYEKTIVLKVQRACENWRWLFVFHLGSKWPDSQRNTSQDKTPPRHRLQIPQGGWLDWSLEETRTSGPGEAATTQNHVPLSAANQTSWFYFASKTAQASNWALALDKSPPFLFGTVAMPVESGLVLFLYLTYLDEHRNPKILWKMCTVFIHTRMNIVICTLAEKTGRVNRLRCTLWQRVQGQFVLCKW